MSDETAINAHTARRAGIGTEISDACARMIASQYQDGEAGAAFATTGAISDPTDVWRDLFYDREGNSMYPGMSTDDKRAADMLGTYLIAAVRFIGGSRGPVVGWSRLWINDPITDAVDDSLVWPTGNAAESDPRRRKGRDVGLLMTLRQVIGRSGTTRRHDQNVWIGVYGDAHDPGQDLKYGEIRAGAAAKEALRPVRATGRNECGTYACLAGWAAIFKAPADTVIAYGIDRVIMPDGGWYTVRGYAASALGLDDNYDDARWIRLDQWLFSSQRSRAEILKALDAMIAHPADSDDDILAAIGVI